MRVRIAKTVCITLPPELLKKAQKAAAREHRTMSELFREALRHYLSEGDHEAKQAAKPEDADGGPDVLHSFRMEK